METSLSHSLLQFGAGEVLRVEGARGRCVVVFHGHVWITQPGDLRDHIVATGESFTFDRPGLALVEALESTSLVILAEPAPVTESIGYEAAWPQTELAPVALAREELSSYRLEERAREMRSEARRRAALGLAQAARKAWAGLTRVAPVRQAA